MLEADPNSNERYTPGHGETAVNFMGQRRADTHAQFFLPHLAPGLALLDCGCGPGTITAGLASLVAPGSVLGVDASADQLSTASSLAAEQGLTNVRFEAASCYTVPLPDSSVDRVFSHALLEHLSAPEEALGEFRRVLAPEGLVGVSSPDWGGFLLTPPSADLDGALNTYTAMQRANGGDPFIGRRLGLLLGKVGFTEVRVDARYERYLVPDEIAAYLADQLDKAGEGNHAQTLRSWSAEPGAMFAQSWVSATARSVAS